MHYILRFSNDDSTDAVQYRKKIALYMTPYRKKWPRDGSVVFILKISMHKMLLIEFVNSEKKLMEIKQDWHVSSHDIANIHHQTLLKHLKKSS